MEVSNQAEAEPNLVPIAYFSGTFGKTQQLWNTTQKDCYAVHQSIQKFSFYLAGTKCTLHCSMPLASFFTTGMSSPILDLWAFELQQFDIQFKHISGKRNIVADAISWLMTLGLYQDNGNDDIMPTEDDVVENIMEEVHAMELVPNSPATTWGNSIKMFCKRSSDKTSFVSTK